DLGEPGLTRRALAVRAGELAIEPLDLLVRRALERRDALDISVRATGLVLQRLDDRLRARERRLCGLGGGLGSGPRLLGEARRFAGPLEVLRVALRCRLSESFAQAMLARGGRVHLALKALVLALAGACELALAHEGRLDLGRPCGELGRLRG